MNKQVWEWYETLHRLNYLYGRGRIKSVTFVHALSGGYVTREIPISSTGFYDEQRNFSIDQTGTLRYAGHQKRMAYWGQD